MFLRGGLGRTSSSTDKYAGLLFAGNNGISAAVQTITGTGQVVFEDGATSQQIEVVEFAISEFFRINSSGVLYVCGTSSVGSEDITSGLQLMSGKYVGVLGVQGDIVVSESEDDSDDDSESIVDIASAINVWAEERKSNYAEFFRVVLAPDSVDSIDDLDWSQHDFTRVMFVGSTDSSSYNMCGTMLGQLCAYPVHQKPSWRDHRIDSGTQWAEVCLIDGSSIPTTYAATDLLSQQGVCFAGYTPRLAGTFWANSRMCCDETSDYAVINNGRVIDKASGLVYDALVTRLDGPIYIDASIGKLDADTVAWLQSKARDAISAGMVDGKSGDDVELSVDSSTGSLALDSVFINPDQNILSTSILYVSISLTPVGSSDTITVDIGLKNPLITT